MSSPKNGFQLDNQTSKRGHLKNGIKSRGMASNPTARSPVGKRQVHLKTFSPSLNGINNSRPNSNRISPCVTPDILQSHWSHAHSKSPRSAQEDGVRNSVTFDDSYPDLKSDACFIPSTKGNLTKPNSCPDIVDCSDSRIPQLASVFFTNIDHLYRCSKVKPVNDISNSLHIEDHEDTEETTALSNSSLIVAGRSTNTAFKSMLRNGEFNINNTHIRHSNDSGIKDGSFSNSNRSSAASSNSPSSPGFNNEHAVAKKKNTTSGDNFFVVDVDRTNVVTVAHGRNAKQAFKVDFHSKTSPAVDTHKIQSDISNASGNVSRSIEKKPEIISQNNSTGSYSSENNLNIQGDKNNIVGVEDSDNKTCKIIVKGINKKFNDDFSSAAIITKPMGNNPNRVTDLSNENLTLKRLPNATSITSQPSPKPVHNVSAKVDLLLENPLRKSTTLLSKTLTQKPVISSETAAVTATNFIVTAALPKELQAMNVGVKTTEKPPVTVNAMITSGATNSVHKGLVSQLSDKKGQDTLQDGIKSSAYPAVTRSIKQDTISEEKSRFPVSHSKTGVESKIELKCSVAAGLQNNLPRVAASQLGNNKPVLDTVEKNLSDQKCNDISGIAAKTGFSSKELISAKTTMINKVPSQETGKNTTSFGNLPVFTKQKSLSSNLSTDVLVSEKIVNIVPTNVDDKPNVTTKTKTHKTKIHSNKPHLKMDKESEESQKNNDLGVNTSVESDNQKSNKQVKKAVPVLKFSLQNYASDEQCKVADSNIQTSPSNIKKNEVGITKEDNDVRSSVESTTSQKSSPLQYQCYRDEMRLVTQPVEHNGPVILDAFESLRLRQEETAKQNKIMETTLVVRTKSKSKIGTNIKGKESPQRPHTSAQKKHPKMSVESTKSENGQSTKVKGKKKKRKARTLSEPSSIVQMNDDVFHDILTSPGAKLIGGIGWHITANCIESERKHSLVDVTSVPDITQNAHQSGASVTSKSSYENSSPSSLRTSRNNSNRDSLEISMEIDDNNLLYKTNHGQGSEYQNQLIPNKYLLGPDHAGPVAQSRNNKNVSGNIQKDLKLSGINKIGSEMEGPEINVQLASPKSFTSEVNLSNSVFVDCSMIGNENEDSDNKLSVTIPPANVASQNPSIENFAQSITQTTDSAKIIRKSNKLGRPVSPNPSLKSTVSTERDLELAQDSDNEEWMSKYGQTQDLKDWDKFDDLATEKFAQGINDSQISVSKYAHRQILTNAKPPIAARNSAVVKAVPSDRSPRFVRKHDSYRVISSGSERRQAVDNRRREKMMSSGTSISLMSADDESFNNVDQGYIVTSRLGRSSAHSHTGSTVSEVSRGSDDVEIIQWKRGNVLGKGAFGTVWCGLTNSGELIAVKMIELNTSDLDKAEQEYEQIQQEVEIIKTIRHRNIVEYLGTCLEDNVVSIFMQYVPGGSIANIVARFGALDEEVFCNYTKQILEGVQYLHANNVIHRDIKGGNVMLMHNAVIKLIDFGCAKKICWNIPTPSSQNQLLKSVRGTPYWMAPEVVREEGHGTQSDIWSIGCTVFEMATKVPPWSDMPPSTAIFAIGSDSTPIPQLPMKFSNEARNFVNACLTRDPLKRPSATHLLHNPFIVHVRKSKMGSTRLS